MSKNNFFAFSVLAIAASLAPALLLAAGKFSYKENSFDYVNGCVGFYKHRKEPFLALNEKVWIFSRDSRPVAGEVVGFVPMAKAKEKLGFPDSRKPDVADDEIGTDDIRCFRSLFADRDEYAEIVKIKPAEADPYGIVIRGLPADAWVLPGLEKPVPMAVKDNPYVDSVRHLVTDACYAPDSRVEVRTSPVLNGRSIVQLVIGSAKKVSLEKRGQIIEKEVQGVEKSYKKFAWPEYKKKKIEEMERTAFFESAEICRFFLDGKRVLRADTFSHVSGRNPDWGHEVMLDSRDWPYLRESSLGFISLDEGKNWDAVFMVYGMETTNFMIQSLDSASVTHYHGATPSFR